MEDHKMFTMTTRDHSSTRIKCLCTSAHKFKVNKLSITDEHRVTNFGQIVQYCSANVFDYMAIVVFWL
jgi:hypothetical protein